MLLFSQDDSCRHISFSASNIENHQQAWVCSPSSCTKKSVKLAEWHFVNPEPWVLAILSWDMASPPGTEQLPQRKPSAWWSVQESLSRSTFMLAQNTEVITVFAPMKWMWKWHCVPKQSPPRPSLFTHRSRARLQWDDDIVPFTSLQSGNLEAHQLCVLGNAAHWENPVFLVIME